MSSRHRKSPCSARRAAHQLALPTSLKCFGAFESLEQRLCMATMPNILVINADDQRFDALQYMPIVQSQLVPESTVFTNSFVPTPICSPSRASLLTGLYAKNHGVLHVLEPWGGFQNFDDSSTLATWLDGAGYNTAMIGKYINGYDQTAYANRNPSATYVPPGWDQWRGMLGASFNSPKISVNGATQQFPGKYSTDVLSDMAVDFIESNRDEDATPFFLYYAPHNPHEPALVADRHQGAYDGIAPHRPPSFNEANINDKPNWVKNQLALMTAAEIAAVDKFRQDQLESMLSVDEGVGRMLAALRQSGQLENTIIIYTSDNGQHWGEHRFDEKGPAWEESIRVPLLVYDGRDPTSQAIDEMALNIDLAPTILQMAGLAMPQAADGRSLVSLMNGATGGWRDDFLIERYIGDGGLYYGLRNERYTYTEYVYTNSVELYDNLNDPYQLTSQHNNPAYAGVRAELAARLQELRASDRTGPTTSNVAAVVSPAGTITLTLRASDATTGGSEVRNSEYFVDAVRNNGLGKALRPVDGLYNGVAENMIVEITGLSPGLHTIYVHSRDISGNWGPMKSIQVDTRASAAPLIASVAAIDFGSVTVGQTVSRQVTLTNGAVPGGPSIRIDPAQASMTPLTAPFSSTIRNNPPFDLAPGQSMTFGVVYAPTAVRNDSATLTIPHSGSNSPLSISLLGKGVSAQQPSVVHRVNAGGPQVAATPAWSADTAASPSPYNNATTGGNSAISTTAATIDMTHSSVPAGTPSSLFQSERFDKPASANLLWDFPVAPGQYEVRLYFAETYAPLFAAGARIFDVSVEGTILLNDYDIFADVGANKGVVKSFVVTSDANLDIDFLRVKENPSVRAIEIRRLAAAATATEISAVAADFDGNQRVDGADFLHWQRTFAADRSGSEDSAAAALGQWKIEYGQSSEAVAIITDKMVIVAADAPASELLASSWSTGLAPLGSPWSPDEVASSAQMAAERRQAIEERNERRFVARPMSIAETSGFASTMFSLPWNNDRQSDEGAAAASIDFENDLDNDSIDRAFEEF